MTSSSHPLLNANKSWNAIPSLTHLAPLYVIEERTDLVPDAIADEHAVVLPLQDADVADVAVPGARRRHRLAGHAQLPRVVLQAVDRESTDHGAL